MKLKWHRQHLVLREPFRISRSVTHRREAVCLELEHDGVVGHGEVVTSVHQGLDGDRIEALLEPVRDVVRHCDDPERMLRDLPGSSAGAWQAPAVLAAVDAALHDLVATRRGVPVHVVAGMSEWNPVRTAHTIGMTTTDRAAAVAGELAERGFDTIKVKLGGADEAEELARLAAVRRAAPHARLLLDPNGAWHPEQALRMLDSARDHGVDAVEQPIAPGAPELFAWVCRRSPVPVIADEDVHTVADLRELASVVGGVNVKLAKCGGVRPALEIVDLARESGIEVMLGCLVASSLGLAPAVHLAGLARWVDLDGHLLLERDPWTGIGGEDGVLRLDGRPGLGVRRAEVAA